MKKNRIISIALAFMLCMALFLTACSNSGNKSNTGGNDNVIDVSGYKKTEINTAISRNITNTGNILNGAFADIDETCIYIVPREGYEINSDIEKVRLLSSTRYTNVNNAMTHGSEIYLFMTSEEGAVLPMKVNFNTSEEAKDFSLDNKNLVCLMKTEERGTVTLYNACKNGDKMYMSTATAIYSAGLNGQGIETLPITLAEGVSFSLSEDEKYIPFSIKDGVIYFVAEGESGSEFVYSYNLGSGETSSFEADCGVYVLAADNQVFYITDSGEIYKTKADGTDTKKVGGENVANINVYKGNDDSSATIYYRTTNGSIGKIVDGKDESAEIYTVESDGNADDTRLLLLDDKIYFYEGKTLYRISVSPAEGEKPEAVYAPAA